MSKLSMHGCSIQGGISEALVLLETVSVGTDVGHGAIETVVQRVLSAAELVHTDTVQETQEVLDKIDVWISMYNTQMAIGTARLSGIDCLDSKSLDDLSIRIKCI